MIAGIGPGDADGAGGVGRPGAPGEHGAAAGAAAGPVELRRQPRDDGRGVATVDAGQGAAGEHEHGVARPRPLPGPDEPGGREPAEHGVGLLRA